MGKCKRINVYVYKSISIWVYIYDNNLHNILLALIPLNVNNS